jgi:peptide-methionine (R)-S-oxide reductase
MTRFIKITGFLALALLFQACYSQPDKTKKSTMNQPDNLPDSSFVNKTDEEWQKLLPSDVYQVARLKGTERPFTSKYEHSKDIGTFYCAVCGNPLFRSDAKFESGCGWPSFYEPISKTSVIYLKDNSFGMERTEVECGRCRSHLGHVFDDGPPPTGLRFCINGVVLDFKKAEAAQKNYDSKK